MLAMPPVPVVAPPAPVVVAPPAPLVSPPAPVEGEPPVPVVVSPPAPVTAPPLPVAPPVEVGGGFGVLPLDPQAEPSAAKLAISST